MTIPKALRERLGIDAGQVLDFDVVDDQLVARKVFERDPVDEGWGILSGRGQTDELLRRLRGPAE